MFAQFPSAEELVALQSSTARVILQHQDLRHGSRSFLHLVDDDLRGWIKSKATTTLPNAETFVVAVPGSPLASRT